VLARATGVVATITAIDNRTGAATLTTDACSSATLLRVALHQAPGPRQPDRPYRC